MPASVKVIQCPSCGGSSPSHSQQCTYCGNYLLHLSPLERRASSPSIDEERDESIHYFRSLKFLYRLFLYGGLLMAVVIYGVMFDDFSETELVTISPIWFLMIIFGTCGLHTEKAVVLILDRKADTLTTLLWAGALYFFFLAIFPEL